jgi:myosin heavy subunit
MQDERNFHIFYLLLANCPEHLRQSLGLKGKTESSVSNFFYLQK